MTVCFFCHGLGLRNSLICEKCKFHLLSQELYYQHKGSLGIFSLVPYDGFFKKLIRSIKGQTYPDLAYTLGVVMADALRPMVHPKTRGIIPIPSKNNRPDHSHFLAMGISAAMNLPIITDVIEHDSTSIDQKALTLEDRKSRGFNLIDPNVDFTNGQWILVDDLVTSGSTLYWAWNTLGRPIAFAASLGFTPKLRGSVESHIKLC